MTAQPAAPDFAGDLQRIHRVITRAIRVCLENSARFSNGVQPEKQALAGFQDYASTLANLLHAHHMGEDDIAFPEVEVRMPSAPIGKLCADHKEMEGIIVKIQELLAAPGNRSSKDVLAGLNAEFERLNEVWNQHIHLEEDVLSAKNISAAFKPYEQADINRRLSEHGQGSGGPDYLLLPFVLYNLEEEDRQHMARLFPPVVTSELIPVVWLDKWSVMKPYLLQ